MRAIVVLALLPLLVSGCRVQSILHPESGAAEAAANLWWFIAVLGVAVWVIVTVLLGIALLHRRRRQDDGEPHSEPIGLVLLGGAAIPALILAVLMASTIWGLNHVASFQGDENANGTEEEALVIEVTGHMWWWEVHYPQQDVTTANELHMPVDRPVKLELTSADVVHSFWVPQLQGKMDMNPGDVNTLWIEANRPGEYRGQCAEYCGDQHANMAMWVHAHEQADFDRLMEEWQGSTGQAGEAADDIVVEGQQVFLGSSCVYCHAIEGTGASGQIGPDLTHIASRRTLAAGTVENNPGTLAAWILDPQSIKPGNHMPATNLDPESLQALLAYLETLE